MAATHPLETPDLRDGTVTAVRAQKNDPERVSVFVDGAFAFGLAAEIAVKAGLRQGLVLSAAEQAGMLALEQQFRARGAALDFIGHRPRTEAEVLKRLARRGFGTDLAEDVVAWLRELGYLDDADYARRFARERVITKRHGPARIRSDLLQRGVERELVDLALGEVVDPVAMRASALDLARVRWESLAGEADVMKRRRKVSDYLARRGYAYDVIKDALSLLEREEG